MLVAADGLHSPLRRAEGLEVPARARRRFGLRQHFVVAPWTDRVEVYLSPGAEAYVTPCGRRGWAWPSSGRTGSSTGSRTRRLAPGALPHARRRLGGAEPDSEPRGPVRSSSARDGAWHRRFALLGDAAGYVDAITGEGMSVALVCAEALAACLPDVVRREGDVRAFAPYVATAVHEFRKYAWTASAVLALARRPRLRRRVVASLAARPRAFEWLLARTVG